MPPDPSSASPAGPVQSDGAAPSVPATPPPVIGAPPCKSPPPRQLLAVILNLCLGLFLADGIISLADDSLNLFFNSHFLATIRALVFFFALLLAILVYGLMGLTPLIPKRWFLPVTLFNPLATLAVMPVLIFCFSRIQQAAVVIGLGQVLVGLWVWQRVQGGFNFHWPPVTANRLAGPGFSWRNLWVFLSVNLLVLLPVVVVYLVLCAAAGVSQFSDGFLALRPGGLTVQVRKYVRADGKTIQLIPMSHIAEAAFYRKVSQSFPTNATILLEGVTDEHNLLTNKISYQRAAASLGLAEQAEEFQPDRGELVPADVDVAVFTPDTLELLNLVMLVHGQGVKPGHVQKLLHYRPPPGFERRLIEDLLRKRNRHLLEAIQSRLAETENIIVPWGAAHMPELAREIQKAGFRLDSTQEYVVIRFGPIWSPDRSGKVRMETSP